MFKRGELRRATDHDRKAADTRLKAARMWQSIYADLPGAQLTPDKRKAAQAFSELQDQLGEYRSLLLRRVLGEKLELDAVAALMLGIAVPADPGAQFLPRSFSQISSIRSTLSRAILGLNRSAGRALRSLNAISTRRRSA